MIHFAPRALGFLMNLAIMPVASSSLTVLIHIIDLMGTWNRWGGVFLSAEIAAREDAFVRGPLLDIVR
jgi:hypothetical protein